MPSHRYSKYIPVLFLSLDLISLNIGFYVANLLKFQIVFLDQPYSVLQAVLNALWIFTFFSARLHHVNRESGLIDHLNRLLTSLVVNLSVIFALWFAIKPFYYSRQHLFYLYLIFSLGAVSWRIFWYFSIRYYRSKGFNIRNVAIVGYSDLSARLVTYFQANPEIGYRFIGYYDDYQDKSLGRISDLINTRTSELIDLIYVYLPALHEEKLKEIIDFAENNLIKVKVISQFSSLGYRNLHIQNYGSIPIVNVTAIPLDNRLNQIIKRAFDIIFSSIVIITILSWLVPLVGLLIKLESNGPIFFRQDRTGLNNRKFKILKFRTMVVHQDVIVKQATKNDTRITRLGAILRKTSIDEFPQFINVFLGDMSVVGPRPHAIKHNEEFQKKIDRFAQRHAMKPGITGLAQAKGFRGETNTFNDISGRVRLDRFYVKNWSIFLDFKIIILTVLGIIRGNEKAY